MADQGQQEGESLVGEEGKIAQGLSTVVENSYFTSHATEIH